MRASGFGVVDSIVTLALVGLVSIISVPAFQRLQTNVRMAGAARSLMLELQALRWRSVASGRSHGLRFSRVDDRWSWTVVRDGNGNGLRSRELASGVDHALGRLDRPIGTGTPVELGFPPIGRPIPAIPPRRGSIDPARGPVRIGRSSMVAFSPIGRSTSGTLYLTDGRRALWAVVIYGRSTRARVWRYDAEERRWSR